MYPEREKINNDKASGLVRCLRCKRQFNQIYTDCPICKFDSAGRAECSICNKVIDQFAFIQNSNKCPYCNSKNKSQQDDAESVQDTKEIKAASLREATQKKDNLFNNIIMIIVGLAFIIIIYFLTGGFEYFNTYCYYVLAFGIIIFIAGTVRLIKSI